jgi:hypothetical protein
MAEASPRPTKDDGAGDASIWRLEMLDLDGSGDEDEEGETELQLPPSRYGGRRSWPSGETPPQPPPYILRPPPPMICAPPPSWGSSPSCTHARGASETSSSHYSRRHGEFTGASYAGRRPAYPQRRRHDGGRRSHSEQQAMRGHEAPPGRYTPYNHRDQRGHRGNERPQGNRVHRGDRGYEAPRYWVQQKGYCSSSSSNQFAGQRDREEDSYVRRQIPAQQVQNGGNRHQYNRDPPRGPGHFPAPQPRHPYARDAGQVDNGHHQARRDGRSNLNDGNHQARRQFWPNQKQHGHSGNQKSRRSDAGLGRSIQYYDDIYNTSQSP